ncbi:holin-like protein [Bacillus sp. OV322]|uniref:CidA/LrgA family protein n=1 Tax=unclassified Bacillus (in: firmicutes) TaxID=185979 RepID=UPI0008E43CDE|nr:MULTISPECIES: CidA/LrgA family protein [unclassified Bacillus (in: firmicutes)]OIK09654.1 CidA/LrgA family protein [Bacillus sp. MUM 13]SFC70339.1 holin-like protein [Bacillus sp. OV322]
MKLITIIIQILILHIFLYLGAGIKHFIHIPVPASMIGLILLFAALMLKIIKLEWIEKGGNWLLAELLLFFIPSAVGIVNYDEILSLQGIKALLLIGVSTFIVMGATAFTAEKISNKKRSEAS